MMLEQIWPFLLEQLKTNQFLAGGAIMGILVGFFHYCKAIPGRIWGKVKSQFFISVEVNDKDEAFRWMVAWLAAHPYSKGRARNLKATTVREGDDNRPNIVLSPANGTHWFFYKRRLVFLHRGKDDDGGGNAAADASKITSFLKPESITVTVLSRKRDIIKNLLEDAQELVHPKKEQRTSILVGRYGNWSVRSQVRPRPLESVILKAGVIEDVIKNIKEFRESEEYYNERGIPYRLGILFEGPPGSGKSSSIAAITSHFRMDLGAMNLSSGGLGDDDLRDLFSTVPKNTAVLVEDIDCVFEQRDKGEDNDSKVTFSGLLNAIDGVAAGEGRILFMTTNHPERLDPALIRPGRADLRYVIGAPDAGQVVRLFQRFYSQATASQTVRFLEALGDPSQASMAGLQGVMVKHRHDPEQAIAHAHQALPEKHILT